MIARSTSCSRRLQPWLLPAALWLTTVPHLAQAATPVSFRNDVMAVLSKSGCNLGTCHGNARGKGGFQLSLRGQDPAGDFAALTREWLSRRVNQQRPEESLLLLKATMQIAHEGGRRFATDTPEYGILRDWIAAGLPADPPESRTLQSLSVEPRELVLTGPSWQGSVRVSATYSDGVVEDVTARAVYETSQPILEVSATGSVQGLRRGEATLLVRLLHLQIPVQVLLLPENATDEWTGPPARNVIDEHVFAKLRRARILPSEICDDATFIRRVSLDLIGLPPSAKSAQAFVAASATDKRERLVDDLLQRPEFADWWALRWADMLRIEEKTLDRKGAQAFHGWLRESFATGKALDQLVHELIAARGSTYSQPAANFYRAMRDPYERSEGVAQLFLGIRLQCAKCHNHPFDRWTQDDYYSWSNLFARVDYKVLENRRRDSNDKHEFDGEQIVFVKARGDVDDPRTGQPRPPRFLGGSPESLPEDADRLLELANWLTSTENPRFAEMLANRTWQQLLGRGIVEPVDDFRATNPPSNPALLAALAGELRTSGYDFRHLVRLIANSTTYQLSAQPNDSNRDDELNFSRAQVRRYSAEQLLDSVSLALDVPLQFAGYPEGMRAQQLAGVNAIRSRDRQSTREDGFLTMFGKPPRLQSCDCERTDEITLNQTFELISGELLNRWLSQSDNRLTALVNRYDDPRELVRQLYWSTLTRAPTAEELDAAAALLGAATDRRSVLEDLAWGLLNSHEFLLRH